MDIEPIKINLVSAEELVVLRGIGQVYAQRIIAYRQEHGPFRTPTDLAQVQGISQSLAEQLAADIDWRTPDEIDAGTITRREFLSGRTLGKLFKAALGWTASNVAWDMLKEGAKEAAATYREAQGMLKDLESVAEELQRPLIRPEPAPTPPIDMPEVTATPEPPQVSILRSGSALEPELVRVPAGPFLMGSNKLFDPAAYDVETPQFLCRLITYDYYIGRYPVTIAEYRRFQDAGGYENRAWWTNVGWEWRLREGKMAPYMSADERFSRHDHPQVGINWYEAVAYCRWLAATTGRPYRLPTEAEWEKAARGTDGRLYPWGNTPPSPHLCNFDQNVGATTPIGRFSPGGDSPYGCVDMAGDVLEWCSSKRRSNYDRYEQDVDEDLEGDARRVLRGGSWWSSARNVRAAARLRTNPFYGHFNLGFRCVVVPRSS